MINKLDKIKYKGKTSIIQLAFHILESRKYPLSFTSSDFEISVWANKKEILVKFKRLIKYIPKNIEESDYIYDLSVNVITKELDPIDTWGPDSFYIPSEQDAKNIEFVKKYFGLPIQGFENKVYEEEDMYCINTENEVAFGKYYIDKNTGEEAMPPMQGSYILKPFQETSEEEFDKDPWIEITV